METTRPPGEIIERRLRNQGSAYISDLVAISGAPKNLVESIVTGLRDEGKVIYHKDLQARGAPLVEWVG